MAATVCSSHSGLKRNERVSKQKQSKTKIRRLLLPSVNNFYVDVVVVVWSVHLILSPLWYENRASKRDLWWCERMIMREKKIFPQSLSACDDFLYVCHHYLYDARIISHSHLISCRSFLCVCVCACVLKAREMENKYCKSNEEEEKRIFLFIR